MQEQLDILEKYLRLQHYSEGTIKNYLSRTRCFLIAFQGHDLKKLGVTDIKNFMDTLDKKKRLSASYRRKLLAAIERLYTVVLEKDIAIGALYPKPQKRIREYLSTEEIRFLIDRAPNTKSRCIIGLLYGSGLRLSELRCLKVSDIDFKSNRIHIRKADRRKSRSVMLLLKLKKDIEIHSKGYPPGSYLFKRQDGSRYSVRSIEKVVNEAAIIAGIKKNVCPRTLRRSFAIHLQREGVEIRYIQKLLGHDSINVTRAYINIPEDSDPGIKRPLRRF